MFIRQIINRIIYTIVHNKQRCLLSFTIIQLSNFNYGNKGQYFQWYQQHEQSPITTQRSPQTIRSSVILLLPLFNTKKNTIYVDENIGNSKHLTFFLVSCVVRSSHLSCHAHWTIQKGAWYYLPYMTFWHMPLKLHIVLAFM